MARNAKSIRSAAGPDPLSTDEATRFESLDAIVVRTVPRFLEMAEALAEISERRLWRQNFDSFRTYLQERGLSRSRFYELRDTGIVLRALGGVESVRLADNSLPSASAIEPLATIAKETPEQVRPVFDEATRRASDLGESQPSASIVREVVRERVAPHPVPKPTSRVVPQRRVIAPVDDAYETDGEGRSVPRAEPVVARPSALPVDPPSPGWQRFLDFAAYCDDKLPAALGQLAVREHGQDRLYRLREFIDAAADEALRLT
jgi:hypothetical protein